MKVYQIPVGPMQNFSYIVEDESTQECIVIDQSWDMDKIIKISKLVMKYMKNYRRLILDVLQRKQLDK